MSTVDTPHPGAAHAGAASSGGNYINAPGGIKAWLTTLDHKRIGVMYLISILSAFFMGGVMAILVRTELLTPGKTIVDADTYNQFFTLHGAIMIFLFIIPGIPAALGNFVLPLMLGAKDVAFPRLNLCSWYLWVIGAVFALLFRWSSARSTLGGPSTRRIAPTPTPRSSG